MISVFTIWAPAIFASPEARLPWTAFFISWAIGSAAWVVTQDIARHPHGIKMAAEHNTHSWFFRRDKCKQLL